MSPDEIKVLIERNFEGIVSKKRNHPDGWSFFLPNLSGSNRVARAVQMSTTSAVRFKKAVSARLRISGEIEVMNPSPSQILDLFAQELDYLRAQTE